jgi:hypothetical protein
MHIAGVAGLVLLAGCVSGPGSLAHDDAAYGVRVIRPGMSEREVSALVGAGTAKVSAGLPDPSEVHYPSGLGIKYDGGTVRSCWTEAMATAGGSGTGVDPTLAAAMQPGAKPAEVAERLGAPAFGYEKKSGVVVLYYPATGVEVTFQDGRLTLWRQTRAG